MVNKTLNEMFGEVVNAVRAGLKERGFRSQGSVFRLLCKKTCGVIQFQRSMSNSSEMLKFTINVGINCGVLLGSWDPPLEKALAMDAHIGERIGYLLPERYDKWWAITEQTNLDSLMQEVCGAVFEKAVPYIKSLLDPDAIVALWESGQSPGLTEFQRIRYLEKLKNTPKA